MKPDQRGPMEAMAFALRAKGLVEKLRDALCIADGAINPSDRDGISLEIWNKRLKSATLTIRDAINHAEEFLGIHDEGAK
jgi:hypothetical protein